LTLLLAAAAAASKPAPAPIHAAPIKIVPPPASVQFPQVQAPQTMMQAHAAWLTHGLAGIFVIAAVALVVLLALQTTKQEGLSGTIGGRVESAYGRMGAEEQLKRATGFAAVVFVLSGFILSLTGI
jgi:preprotein translocase subunit SecG